MTIAMKNPKPVTSRAGSRAVDVRRHHIALLNLRPIRALTKNQIRKGRLHESRISSRSTGNVQRAEKVATFMNSTLNPKLFKKVAARQKLFDGFVDLISTPPIR